MAVVNTQVVGRQVAVLLYHLLQTYALMPSKIHYVGHSLGAQVGHFFANYFKTITGNKRIQRITGKQKMDDKYIDNSRFADLFRVNFVIG